MLRYTKTGFRGENLGTLENTKKNEVIPSYSRKNKSPHGLPRQHSMKVENS